MLLSRLACICQSDLLLKHCRALGHLLITFTHPLQGYREDDGLLLESDTDEQLLIHIPFNQAVRLSGFIIKSTVGGQAPKTVKLFVNQPTIGFGGA